MLLIAYRRDFDDDEDGGFPSLMIRLCHNDH